MVTESSTRSQRVFLSKAHAHISIVSLSQTVLRGDSQQHWV